MYLFMVQILLGRGGNRWCRLLQVVCGILMLRKTCEGLEVNECNGTQICHHCYISTMGEFGCVEVLSGDYGPFMTRQDCIDMMWIDTQLLGVDYDPDAKRCRGYYCDYGLGFSDSGRTVYRKTCDIDCFELTLTLDEGQMIDLSQETFDSFTLDTNYAHTCFKRACDSTPYFCSAAFDDVTNSCFKFTSCVPYCTKISNSSWNVVTKVCHDDIDCGPPKEIENGQVFYNGTWFSDNATYVCDDGYNLQTSTSSDNGSIVCDLYGNWTTTSAYCKPVRCGSLSFPVNSVFINISGTEYGDRAYFECKTGYQMIGSNVVECLYTGAWSTKPVCEEVDCGYLPTPINGYVEYMSGSTLYGSVVYYICYQDKTNNGEGTRVCQADGFWNGTEPSCLVTDCGGLPNPDNGYVDTSNGTTLNKEAIYECDDGYMLEGVETRRCLGNGSWEYTQPVCTIKDCGDPTAPPNGSITTLYGTTYSRVAIVSCHQGFEPDSSVYRTCLSSGLWSEPGPSCLQMATTSTTPAPPKLTYIMPCNCVVINGTKVTNDTDDVIKDLVQSTAINVANTTRYLYRLKSRDDRRQSSTLIGYGTVTFMCLIFVFMLWIDIVTIYQQRQICCTRVSRKYVK